MNFVLILLVSLASVAVVNARLNEVAAKQQLHKNVTRSEPIANSGDTEIVKFQISYTYEWQNSYYNLYTAKGVVSIDVDVSGGCPGFHDYLVSNDHTVDCAYSDHCWNNVSAEGANDSTIIVSVYVNSNGYEDWSSLYCAPDTYSHVAVCNDANSITFNGTSIYNMAYGAYRLDPNYITQTDDDLAEATFKSGILDWCAHYLYPDGSGSF